MVLAVLGIGGYFIFNTPISQDIVKSESDLYGEMPITDTKEVTNNNEQTFMTEEQKETVTVTMTTSKGVIELELFAGKSPQTVANFTKLAGEGFYNGTRFHRVIPDFMIQGGDPNTRLEPENRAIHGTGGPGYTFADEINDVPHTRGVISMANAGPNTNGSQFFIVTAEATPHLNGKHTVFGRVVSGMEVVDAIEAVKTDPRDNPLEAVVVESVVIK